MREVPEFYYTVNESSIIVECKNYAFFVDNSDNLNAYHLETKEFFPLNTNEIPTGCQAQYWNNVGFVGMQKMFVFILTDEFVSLHFNYIKGANDWFLDKLTRLSPFYDTIFQQIGEHLKGKYENLVIEKDTFCSWFLNKFFTIDNRKINGIHFQDTGIMALKKVEFIMADYNNLFIPQLTKTDFYEYYEILKQESEKNQAQVLNSESVGDTQQTGFVNTKLLSAENINLQQENDHYLKILTDMIELHIQENDSKNSLKTMINIFHSRNELTWENLSKHMQLIFETKERDILCSEIDGLEKMNYNEALSYVLGQLEFYKQEIWLSESYGNDENTVTVAIYQKITIPFYELQKEKILNRKLVPTQIGFDNTKLSSIMNDDMIDKFLENEKRLKADGFITEQNTWINGRGRNQTKSLKDLANLVLLLENKRYLKLKYERKQLKDSNYKMFFESRYKVKIKKQFENAKKNKTKTIETAKATFQYF